MINIILYCVAGIETLGVFHPHWLSASRSSQRELISRFVASLQSPSTSTQESFKTSLSLAEPTDVAAVLKWGLRHLKLENSTFGSTSSSSNDGWEWYLKFAEAERVSDYPADAYSSKLLPLLPSRHTALLKHLLDLLSSVAAHAQGNGMFNTKLCKDLAWWAISSRKWDGTNAGQDAWTNFYLAWDRSSRILEHIMLAYLRSVQLPSPGCSFVIESQLLTVFFFFITM